MGLLHSNCACAWITAASGSSGKKRDPRLKRTVEALNIAPPVRGPQKETGAGARSTRAPGDLSGSLRPGVPSRGGRRSAQRRGGGATGAFSERGRREARGGRSGSQWSGCASPRVDRRDPLCAREGSLSGAVASARRRWGPQARRMCPATRRAAEPLARAPADHLRRVLGFRPADPRRPRPRRWFPPHMRPMPNLRITSASCGLTSCGSAWSLLFERSQWGARVQRQQEMAGAFGLEMGMGSQVRCRADGGPKLGDGAGGIATAPARGSARTGAGRPPKATVAELFQQTLSAFAGAGCAPPP